MTGFEIPVGHDPRLLRTVHGRKNDDGEYDTLLTSKEPANVPLAKVFTASPGYPKGECPLPTQFPELSKADYARNERKRAVELFLHNKMTAREFKTVIATTQWAFGPDGVNGLGSYYEAESRESNAVT